MSMKKESKKNFAQEMPSTLNGSPGIEQLMKVLESGAKEARDLLLNECDVLFKCRYCTRVFGCLENFSLHKRYFCQGSHEKIRASNVERIRQIELDTCLKLQSVSTDKSIASPTDLQNMDLMTTIYNRLTQQKKPYACPEAQVLDVLDLPYTRGGEVFKANPECGIQKTVEKTPEKTPQKEGKKSEKVDAILPQDSPSRYSDRTLRNRRDGGSAKPEIARLMSISDEDIVKRCDKLMPHSADYTTLTCLHASCYHLLPFASIAALAYHVTIRHVVQKSKEKQRTGVPHQIKCLLCNITLKSRENLRFHMISRHTNVKKEHLRHREEEQKQGGVQTSQSTLRRGKRNQARRVRSLSPSSNSSGEEEEGIDKRTRAKNTKALKVLEEDSSQEKSHSSVLKSDVNEGESTVKEVEEQKASQQIPVVVELEDEGTPSCSSASNQSIVGSLLSDDWDTDGETVSSRIMLDTVGSSQGKEMDSSQVVLDVVRSMLDVLCADENIQGRPKTSENKRRKGKAKKALFREEVITESQETATLTPDIIQEETLPVEKRKKLIPRKRRLFKKVEGTADSLTSKAKASSKESVQRGNGESLRRPERQRKRPGWWNDSWEEKERKRRKTEAEKQKDGPEANEDFVYPPEKTEKPIKRKRGSKSKLEDESSFRTPPVSPRKKQQSLDGNQSADSNKFFYTPRSGKHIYDRMQASSKDGETAGEDPQFGSRRRKQNFGNVEEGDDFQIVQLGEGRVQRRSDLASVPVFLSEQQQNIFFAGLNQISCQGEREMYECKYCKDRMPNIRDGRRHMVAHLRVMRLRCALCNAGAFFCIDMRNHLQMRACPQLHAAPMGIVSPGIGTPCMTKAQADSLTFIAHPTSPGRTLFTSGKIVSILSSKPYLPDPVIEESILGPSRVPPRLHSPKKVPLKLIKSAMSWNENLKMRAGMQAEQPSSTAGDAQGGAGSKEEEVPQYYEDPFNEGEAKDMTTDGQRRKDVGGEADIKEEDCSSSDARSVSARSAGATGGTSAPATASGGPSSGSLSKRANLFKASTRTPRHIIEAAARQQKGSPLVATAALHSTLLQRRRFSPRGRHLVARRALSNDRAFSGMKASPLSITGTEAVHSPLEDEEAEIVEVLEMSDSLAQDKSVLSEVASNSVEPLCPLPSSPAV